MKYLNLLCILIAALSPSRALYAQQAVNVKDSLALIDFYNSTNGPNWYQNQGWETGPVDTWYGIKVTDGRVTEIRLIENYVKGPIPESFGNLTKLNSLILDYGGISSLPESFGNLTSLKHLSLFDNFVDSLPESIGNLANLEYLSFDEGHRLVYVPESLGKLGKLSYLNLSFNQLTSLPESIGNLANLKDLIVIQNKLNSLPESIGKLVNLANLNLHGNELTSLPASFANLTNLQILDLNSNQLTFFEPLGNLANLRSLSLADNQVNELPASLGNLSNLEYLYLDKNKLSVLPDYFGNLTKLTNLGLSDNQLNALPASFGSLTNLKVLSLGNNQLSTLPDWFGNLTSLTRLSLDNNQLSYLPESFCSLTKLIYLSLQNNQLISLPASFGNLTSLSWLDIANNQLDDLPATFGNVIPSINQFGWLIMNDNKFTFEDLEWILKAFRGNIRYAPQDNFKLTRQGITLIASVGGTPANNIYYWYRNDTLETTIQADSTYTPKKSGNYRAEVTNSVATKLRLVSEPVAYTAGPVVNITDVTIYESDGKAKVMVHIDEPVDVPLRLSFKTVAGTATAHGPTKDYTSRVGYVKIRAGETMGKIRIPVRKDKLQEGDETFYVVIRKKGFREDISVVGRDTALVTIRDGIREPDMTAVSPVIVGSRSITSETNEPPAFLVSASPNPSKGAFRITVSGRVKEPIDLRITNELGVQIDIKRRLLAGQTILIGRSYLPGTYFLTARSGSSISTITLIRQ